MSQIFLIWFQNKITSQLYDIDTRLWETKVWQCLLRLGKYVQSQYIHMALAAHSSTLTSSEWFGVKTCLDIFLKNVNTSCSCKMAVRSYRYLFNVANIKSLYLFSLDDWYILQRQCAGAMSGITLRKSIEQPATGWEPRVLVQALTSSKWFND